MSTLHWFRKGLRLHDNPSLIEACKNSNHLFPVFCLDPYFANPDVIGINRYSFLLQSLVDLDLSLRALGSRLYVLKGSPKEKIVEFVLKWKVTKVTFEFDSEPFSLQRDKEITELLKANNVEIFGTWTHVLHHPEIYYLLNQSQLPKTFTTFYHIFKLAGEIRPSIPSPIIGEIPSSQELRFQSNDYNVPTLTDMGYKGIPTSSFLGGETEALKRLSEMIIQNKTWVQTFSKPSTSPNSLEPSTTVLSPYLKFGCLSVALFYHEIMKIISSTNHTEPPCSLLGQLLWREFYYLHSFYTPNFDKIEGNPYCKQIVWDQNTFLLDAWKLGKTGYPFIDAIMTQLRIEGWIHHLARHAVACFLTRGDLYQSWVEGAKVFDLYLLDADWALNNGNWQWLSCSNFYYQYYRCYSPISFGKKTDPEGIYIRKWIPTLANFPSKYIYEPWKAPKEIIEQFEIGKEYPFPVVDHEIVSKKNMLKMTEAFSILRTINSSKPKKRKCSNI